MFSQPQLLAEAQNNATTKERLAEIIQTETNTDLAVLNEIIDKPNADNEILRSVANHAQADHTTWLAIAQEAGSDAETLHLLASKEDTNATDDENRAFLTAVLAHANVSAQTLPVVATHSKVNRALIGATIAPFQRMVVDAATTADDLNHLASLAIVFNRARASALVASNANTSAETLQRLATEGDRDEALYVAIAGHANAAPDLLRGIAAVDTMPTAVLAAVVARADLQTLPLDVLTAIVAHPNSAPGGLIGGNTIRADIQAEFERRISVPTVSEADLVVMAGALAERLGFQTLMGLGDDKLTEAVLQAVAANVNATRAVLTPVANHTNATLAVRCAVYNHANVSNTKSRHIAAELNDKVDNAATTDEAELVVVAGALRDVPKMQQLLALQADDATKEKVTKDVLLALAGNPNADVDVLRVIAQSLKSDDDVFNSIRARVATMTAADVVTVDQAIVAADNVTAAALEAIAQETDNEAVLQRIAGSEKATNEVLSGVIQNPDVTDGVLSHVVTHNALCTDRHLSEVLASPAVGPLALDAVAKSDKADEALLIQVARITRTPEILEAVIQRVGVVTEAVLMAAVQNAQIDDQRIALAVANEQATTALIDDVVTRNFHGLTADAIAQSTKASEAALQVISRAPAAPKPILEILARNPNATEAVLTDIIGHANADDDVLAIISSRDNLPAAVEQALITSPKVGPATIATLDADDLAAPEARLMQVAQHAQSAHVLAFIPQCTNVTEAVLQQIVGNAVAQANDDALTAVVSAAQATDAVLAAARPHAVANGLVNALAAINGSEKLGAATLQAIAQDAATTDAELAQIVANPNTTQAVLDDVLANGNYGAQAKAAVAASTKADEATLQTLSGDNATDQALLLALADNTAATDAVLRDVIDHDNVDDAVLAQVSAREDLTDVAKVALLSSDQVGAATAATLDEKYTALAEADLQTVAQNAYSVDVLAFIPQCTNATEAVLLEVVGNANAQADDNALTAVVNAQSTTDAVLAAARRHAVANGLVNAQAAIAAHPNTGEVTLRAIAQDGATPDAALARAAAHPNATPAVLNDVMGNGNLHALALAAVAGSPHVTEAQLLAVIADVNVNDTVLAAIANRSDDDPVLTQPVMNAFIASPEIGENTIAAMDALEADEAGLLQVVGLVQSPALLTKIAEFAGSNENVLRAIVANHHSDDVTLAAAVRNPNATFDVLDDVMNSGREQALSLAAIAGSEHANEAMLTTVARHVQVTSGVLKSVAERGDVVEAVLQRIVARNRAQEDVLVAVANKTTNDGLLEDIANHRSVGNEAYQAILANENASERALRLIAPHMAVESMDELVKHGNVNDAVLQVVLRRGDAANLSMAARVTMAESAQDVRVLRAIEGLAGNDADVLTAIARNEQADDALLGNIIAAGFEAKTFEAVASNPNTDIAELRLIAAEGDATEQALAAIAAHDNADVALLVNVIGHDNAGALVLAAVEGRIDGLNADAGVQAAVEQLEESLTPTLRDARDIANTGEDGGADFAARMRVISAIPTATTTDTLDLYAEFMREGRDVAQTPVFATAYANYRREAAQDRQGLEQRAEQRRVTPEDVQAIAQQRDPQLFEKLGMK